MGSQRVGHDWLNWNEHLILCYLISFLIRILCNSWFLTKEPLYEVKEESKKVGLKLNIEKTTIMALGPITSGQIDGETMETVRDFIFLGSKITAMVTAAMKLKDTCSLEEMLWPT